MTSNVPAVRPSAEAPGDHRPDARGALDLRGHFNALRRFWRSVLLCTVLGVLAAGAVTLTIQPQYETRITFFVVAPTGTNISPLQADEFAQRRINSYVGVVRSENMAAEIVQDTGLDITPDEVQEMISTSVNPETVLMNVTVTDTSAGTFPDRRRRRSPTGSTRRSTSWRTGPTATPSSCACSPDRR